MCFCPPPSVCLLFIFLILLLWLVPLVTMFNKSSNVIIPFIFAVKWTAYCLASLKETERRPLPSFQRVDPGLSYSQQPPQPPEELLAHGGRSVIDNGMGELPPGMDECPPGLTHFLMS